MTEPLTEQDIQRFRVGDILFNDEQAKMFCELAMKGLRIETSPADIAAALTYLHESTAPDGQWADQAVHGFVGAMLKTLQPSATARTPLVAACYGHPYSTVQASKPPATPTPSIEALKELLLTHADYDDGEGNKDAAVLRGRLLCIRDILRGT